MKFAENSTQSAEFLRQAIPLMVKYNIPPNPLNYALWYAYVSNKIPNLNYQMDQTLDTYGTCPSMLSEQLFREYVINDEIADSEKTQAQLIALAANLSEHADDAAKHTNDYSLVLENSLEALNNPEQALPLEAIITRLAENTATISETTARFQQQIADAQAEIAALKDELQKTRQDARVDPLTGLYNRRVFDSELAQLVGTAQQRQTTLVMVDVDHFKKFNDDYGHLMGDKVLQYCGKLLKEECSDASLPVRFGGEEFAILMMGQTPQQGAELAENLRKKIQAIRIKQKKSGKVISSVTASFGISSLKQEDNSASFVERADKALYKAKQSGRNQVQIIE